MIEWTHWETEELERPDEAVAPQVTAVGMRFHPQNRRYDHEVLQRIANAPLYWVPMAAENLETYVWAALAPPVSTAGADSVCRRGGEASLTVTSGYVSQTASAELTVALHIRSS